MLYTILKHNCTELEVTVKVCVKNISKLVYCKVFIRCGHRGFGLRSSTLSTSTVYVSWMNMHVTIYLPRIIWVWYQSPRHASTMPNCSKTFFSQLIRPVAFRLKHTRFVVVMFQHRMQSDWSMTEWRTRQWDIFWLCYRDRSLSGPLSLNSFVADLIFVFSCYGRFPVPLNRNIFYYNLFHVCLTSVDCHTQSLVWLLTSELQETASDRIGGVGDFQCLGAVGRVCIWRWCWRTCFLIVMK